MNCTNHNTVKTRKLWKKCRFCFVLKFRYILENILGTKVILERKLIAVAYTLRTY